MEVAWVFAKLLHPIALIGCLFPEVPALQDARLWSLVNANPGNISINSVSLLYFDARGRGTGKH